MRSILLKHRLRMLHVRAMTLAMHMYKHTILVQLQWLTLGQGIYPMSMASGKCTT